MLFSLRLLSHQPCLVGLNQTLVHLCRSGHRPNPRPFGGGGLGVVLNELQSSLFVA